MSSSDAELPPLLQGGSSPAYRPSTKRTRTSESGNTSDSAFFSSDDLADASVNKYASPLRKKQYKRAWYETEEPGRIHSYEQMRDATRRPKDSGIYMNSDTSNSSADDGFSVDELKVTATKAASKKMEAFMEPSDPPRRSDDSIVEAAVTACVDQGLETLDLMNRSLAEVSSSVFLPLQQLVRLPRFDPSAYIEESLQTLTPALKVYLGNNALARVPGSLFGLESLSVLSLRGNRLTELPASVSHARKLVELNVASNNLRWLPWELLRMLQEGPDRVVHTWPNPFVSRGASASEQQGNASDPSDVSSESITGGTARPAYQFKGASAIAFFQQCGALQASSPPAPSRTRSDVIPMSAAPKSALQRQIRSRAPSLYELALRVCADSPSLPDLPSFLDPDTPQSVFDGILQAQANTYQGGRSCSVCEQAYIIPRAEWIEYWDSQARAAAGTSDSFPFLRRACSWACAMDAKLGEWAQQVE